MRIAKVTSLALALAGAATAGVVIKRRGTQVPAAPTAALIVPVVTAKVGEGDVPIMLKGVDTVQAAQVATIRSQVTGTLQAVDFAQGQAVKRGDVLAQVDLRVSQARLDQARAQLARDQAQSANVDTNLDRNEPLLRCGYATAQQAADQKAQLAQSQATLKDDQAAVEDAQTQLDFATLRAPFDGVTGFRLIDAGNLVRPTDANGVLVLTQVQPIDAVFTLPAAD